MHRFDRYEDPRRRLLIRALASGAFALGVPGAGALAAELFGSRPARLPPGQSIFRMSGTVSVNGTPATMQTPIGPGDTIVTGPGSEVVFVLGANAFILRADSNMTVEAEKESLIISGLRLISGKLLSVFPSGKSQTQIRTGTATIGIRGTGFYIESDPELTYFCTCYGVVDVSSTTDPDSRETIAARHHDRPVYIAANAQSGQAIRTAPFINHTDQELMLIETLVGRSTPFVFPKENYKAPRRQY
jgi:hypothetical protein